MFGRWVMAVALGVPAAALAQDDYDPVRRVLGEIMEGCLANSEGR